MAILYVGPKQNPDFSADYFLSPLLAPMALLAHFPPVLMICGEKDPFVDDTVILAGRIREAKRARKAEAQRKEDGRPKGSKFGEGLRMSTSPGAARRRPVDPILDDEEEDWVQVKIYEGWGHGKSATALEAASVGSSFLTRLSLRFVRLTGFFQMASVMPEVKIVIGEIADWMMGTFEQNSELRAAATNATLNATESSFLPRPNGVPPSSFHDTASFAPHQDLPLSFTPKKHRLPGPFHIKPTPDNQLPSSPLSRPPSPAAAIDGLPDNSGVVPTSDSIFPVVVNGTPMSPSPPATLPRSLPSILASALSRSVTPTSISGINPPGSTTPRTASASSPASAPLDEAELMRRRRLDAVWGMGAIHSEVPSDGDEGDGDEGSEAGGGFRSAGTSVRGAEELEEML